MNKNAVRAAEAALERLIGSCPTGGATADAEALRAFLSSLKHMEFVPDWGVHVDGHPIQCNDHDDALCLLEYCLTHKPQGGAYLVRRDHLRSGWAVADTSANIQESHV